MSLKMLRLSRRRGRAPPPPFLSIPLFLLVRIPKGYNQSVCTPSPLESSANLPIPIQLFPLSFRYKHQGEVGFSGGLYITICCSLSVV